MVELVYDESIKEEYRREQEEQKTLLIIDNKKLETAAVFSRVLKDHTFKKMEDGMALNGMTTTLVLTAEDWIRFAKEIVLALKQLEG